MRFFSAEDVKKALPMRAAVEAVKNAFIQLSDGEAVVPGRIHMDIPEHGLTALVMPSYLPKIQRLGLKLISLCRKNPAKGLPFAQAVVLVMDAVNGTPLAVMDGAAVTAIRTGAASGAATNVLARGEARVAAVFGAGIQGRAQLEAVCAVRPIKKAYVFEPDEQRAELYAREMSHKVSIEVKVSVSAADLREADIVCTATTSSEPVFSDGDLKSGVHINAVGSYKPEVREIPPETVCRAKVIVDHRESSLAEAGDLIIPLRQGLITESHIYAELGEVLSGKIPGRTSDDEITLFKSVGNAVQDLAAACLVLQNAG
jgi:ornithine cyclodeaminase/alanine dehydrogenase-like protein (mu-crystallin family)